MARSARADTDSTQTRMLDVVGLSDVEERAYTALVDHPGVTVTELATLLHMSRTVARTALSGLAREGLVTHTPDRTPRYFPAPPDTAIEALITRRQRELERVRKAASRLSRKATKSRRTATELAEIITGTNAVSRHIDDLQRNADQEIVATVRPPFPPDAISGTKGILSALERGVTFKAIYDRATLAESHDLDPFNRSIAAGEQARVFSPIPAPMIIADRSVGLIPFDLHDPDTAWLMLRASPVLDIFAAFFDTVWDRAAPLRITHHGALDVQDTPVDDVPEHQEQLLTDLMAAGLRDDVISAQLKVSPRTLDRRVRALMETLGAKTRFQAGWLAAHRSVEQARSRKRRPSKARSK